MAKKKIQKDKRPLLEQIDAKTGGPHPKVAAMTPKERHDSGIDEMRSRLVAAQARVTAAEHEVRVAEGRVNDARAELTFARGELAGVEAEIRDSGVLA